MVHDQQIGLNKTLVLVLISILCLCSAISFSYNFSKLCGMHPFLYPSDREKFRLPFSTLLHPWKNRSQLLVCVYKLVSVLNLSQHEITSNAVKDYLKEFKLIADVGAIKQAWWAQNHVSQIWISMQFKKKWFTPCKWSSQASESFCHLVLKNGSAVWKVNFDPLCRYLYYLEWRRISHHKYVVPCHP